MSTGNRITMAGGFKIGDQVTDTYDNSTHTITQIFEAPFGFVFELDDDYTIDMDFVTKTN